MSHLDLVSEPLFLDPWQLVARARFYAAEVSRGAYPFVAFNADARWQRRIFRDRRVDVWLISWLPGQGTQLHDHGGSSGSFTVVDGTLTEAMISGPEGRKTVCDYDRPTGEAFAFGPGHIHDVRNLTEIPAVSVHAFSPPLTTMTFYDLANGFLRQLSSLVTDDPKPAYKAPRAS